MFYLKEIIINQTGSYIKERVISQDNTNLKERESCGLKLEFYPSNLGLTLAQVNHRRRTNKRQTLNWLKNPTLIEIYLKCGKVIYILKFNSKNAKLISEQGFPFTKLLYNFELNFLSC